MTTLPLYHVEPETQDGHPGWRICLNFRDQYLPIPGKWYRDEHIAHLAVKLMQREDYALWQLSSLARPDREYDEHGNVIDSKKD